MRKQRNASRAAQLKAAQAQLETAQINLDYTEIYSPSMAGSAVRR